ncbi:MAG: hypothetical protein ACI4XL_02980 [Bacillus sp. (in: firmicutes)]
MWIAITAIVLGASIPITALLTEHFQKQTKLKGQMLKDQLELERLKQANFISETEKLKLELKRMELEHTDPFEQKRIAD